MLDDARWKNPNLLTLQVGNTLRYATLPPDVDLTLPLDEFVERYVKPAFSIMLQTEVKDAEILGR